MDLSILPTEHLKFKKNWIWKIMIIITVSISTNSSRSRKVSIESWGTNPPKGSLFGEQRVSHHRSACVWRGIKKQTKTKGGGGWGKKKKKKEKWLFFTLFAIAKLLFWASINFSRHCEFMNIQTVWWMLIPKDLTAFKRCHYTHILKKNKQEWLVLQEVQKYTWYLLVWFIHFPNWYFYWSVVTHFCQIVCPQDYSRLYSCNWNKTMYCHCP